MLNRRPIERGAADRGLPRGSAASVWRRGAAALAAAALLAVLPAGGAHAGNADHRKLPALQKDFRDGSEVTRACLSCHTEAGVELQGTAHWRWMGPEVQVPGKKGKVRIGKANALNNFCIGIQSNEASCTKCHVGFGWKDKHYDFSRQDRIDCLVCHDGTGEYVKAPGPSDEPPDFRKLAQGVGKTSMRTCGSCHFAGGGGEGVKHGDLDPSLLEAKKELDVHMAKDGLGFSCSSCHRGEEVGHRLKGRLPSVSVDAENRVHCESCHGEAPHGRDFVFRTEKERSGAANLPPGHERGFPWESARRNWHTRRIACQTCHIPRFAREFPTKLYWDWAKAGRRKPDGRPEVEFDADGNMSYLGIKGAFTWGKDLVPTYRWWNGTSGRYLLGDSFDPSKTLVLNPPIGSSADPASKVWPFKVHGGRQPYDLVHRTLIQPKLAGEKGSGAYWSDFDWDKAARKGMAYAGLPYSGKMGFAQTEMYWPITHTVAQGDKGLSCADCHSRQGRLAGVPGLYIPGRDRSLPLDVLGWLSALLSLFGIGGHALLRWLGARGKLGWLDRLEARVAGWRKR